MMIPTFRSHFTNSSRELLWVWRDIFADILTTRKALSGRQLSQFFYTRLDVILILKMLLMYSQTAVCGVREERLSRVPESSWLTDWMWRLISLHHIDEYKLLLTLSDGWTHSPFYVFFFSTISLLCRSFTEELGDWLRCWLWLVVFVRYGHPVRSRRFRGRKKWWQLLWVWEAFHFDDMPAARALHPCSNLIVVDDVMMLFHFFLSFSC